MRFPNCQSMCQILSMKILILPMPRVVLHVLSNGRFHLNAREHKSLKHIYLTIHTTVSTYNFLLSKFTENIVRIVSVRFLYANVVVKT